MFSGLEEPTCGEEKKEEVEKKEEEAFVRCDG